MPQKHSSTTTKQTPHVKLASVTLPPDVKGDPKGELVIIINSLQWHYRKPPQQVQARLKWWGGAVDTVVPFHSTRGAGAAFPITCGPRYLARYLKDMGSLVVGVEECPAGRVVGTISIAVSQLDVGKPVEAKVPCHGTHEQVLATAEVSMRVHYTQLMSSFEINEHLASTDKQLPLYPLPDVQGAKGRQPLTATAQGHKAAMASAADKENTEVGSTESSRNRSLAGHNALSQSESVSGMALNGSATASASTVAKEQTAVTTPQQQQCYKAIVTVPSAGGQAAAAEAACAKADPLLDVIQKAEQLKVAMEQAASRGISLGLSNVMAGHPGVLTGPQLLPGQQPSLQLLLPNLQQQRLSTPWLHDVGYLGFNAAGVMAPDPAAPSAVAREAVRACFYRPMVTTGSMSTLPAPTENLALSYGGVSVGYPQPAAAVQSRLSPLAAALLQMPHSLHEDDANSDASSGSGSSSTAGDSSQVTELEDLEELEELLLQELFRAGKTPNLSPVKKQDPVQQQHQQDQQMAAADPEPSAAETISKAGQQSAWCQATSTAAPSNVAHRAAHEQTPMVSPAAAETTAGTPSGPQLLVVLSAVQGVASPAGQPTARLTAVIKSAGLNTAVDLTQLLENKSSICTGSSIEGVSAVVTGPSCLSGPTLATDRPCLAVEIWSHKAAEPAAVASETGAGELSGIVKVPLQLIPPPAAAAAGLEPPCLATGTYPIYDVLHGRYAGSLKLQVSLVAETKASSAHQVEGQPTAAADEAAAAAVLAVRHVIAVTLHSVCAVPDEQQLKLGGQPVPDSRFLKYSFPGEDPLFTQEVAIVAAATFSAHAQHTVLLPPGTTVAECLLEGGGEEPDCLVFELYDKWQDDTDTLLASGALPLQQVLALVQVNHLGTSESSSVMRTFLVQLELAAGTGAAQVQPPDQAVLLQVTVSYTASNCYTLDDEDVDCVSDIPDNLEDVAGEGGDSSGQPTAAAEPAAAVGGQAILHNSGLNQPHGPADLGHEAPAAAVQSASPAVVASSIQQQQMMVCGQEESDTDCGSGGAVEQPFSPHQQQQQHQGVGMHDVTLLEPSLREPAQTGQGSTRCIVDEHFAAVKQPSHFKQQGDLGGMIDQQHDQETSMQQQQQLLEEDQSSVDAAKLQHNSKQQQQEQQLLSAELCVEVIRACGLQVAVAEAERCLGGSSSLLGRARHLGPHPYVTVDLLSLSGYNSSTMTPPIIKTPFQAQTFCPQFHYKQIIPLTLDGNTVTALACQHGKIELWHHCPRSQAVAAALSHGHSSSFVMGGQQQVLLGVAGLPLQGLLVKPQGIRCWTVLKSPQGVAVGAVQVALYFTHIGGQAVQQCPPADCPIARYPQLLQLLPHVSASQLVPLVTGPPPGFNAQLAAVSVHIQELLLPGGDDLLLERPKIAQYVATYRLPGCERKDSTHSKANSSQRTAGSLLAQSWHVDWQYCGRHWVRADWRLAKALICYPLVITVAKQEPSRRRSSSSSGGTVEQQQQQQFVPMGSVEVDLAPLLHVRPGAQRPSCRWLSGVHSVVHPMAKNLGNVHLKVKVLLELQPVEAPAADEMKGTAAYWEISGPLAALPAPALPPKEAAVAAERKEPARLDISDNQQQQKQQHLLRSAGDDLHVHCEVLQPAAVHTEQGQLVSTSRLAVLDTSTGIGAFAAHSSDSSCKVSSPQSWEVLDDSSPSASGSGVVTQALTSAVGSDDGATRPAAVSAAAAAAAELPAVLRVCGTRLTAEISHVSAPTSAAVSRSISPVLDPSQQQPQTTVVQPSAAAVLNQGQEQQQQQQQQKFSSPLGMPAQQQGLNDVRVCVEAALNLELPHLAPGSTACLYVQHHWQNTHDKVTTPLVTAAVGPLGHTASAKWCHCAHLPLGSETYTAGADAGDSAAAELLILQVWLRPLAAAAAECLPAIHAGIAAVSAAGDILLGCAELDLAALQMLGSIEGWYNICDERQQMKGQLKVSLTPAQQHTAVRQSSQFKPGQHHQTEEIQSTVLCT